MMLLRRRLELSCPEPEPASAPEIGCLPGLGPGSGNGNSLLVRRLRHILVRCGGAEERKEELGLFRCVCSLSRMTRHVRGRSAHLQIVASVAL